MDMHAASQAYASIDAGENLLILFDNNTDAECTVVTVEGQDQAHLLMNLAGAFTTAGLVVVSASITSDDGRVLDVFRVQTMDGQKVCLAAHNLVIFVLGHRCPLIMCLCFLFTDPRKYF